MRRFLTLALAALTLPALAQVPQSAPPYDPVVNPDHTVTFNVDFPNATAVALSLEGYRASFPMEKSPAGVWTVTTPVLKPEWYNYHFDVDKTGLLDPHNFILKTSLVAAANSFLLPAETPMPWEVTAVPHGVVHQHGFTTKIVTGLNLNQDEYYVYTPAGYDPRGKTRYPVLYLLHGWSDIASGWNLTGHAKEILDTMIAQGKIKPMIVVMPLGYGNMSFVRSGFGVWRDPAAVESNVDLFGRMLLDEVLPAVERDYLVSARREDRAIAGLSMGGLEAITVGLKNTDKFAYIGGFSAAVPLVKPDAFATIDPKKANLKLLWIACGTEDELIEPNRKLSTRLIAAGFPVTPIETPGMHTWLVWRDNLVHFTPLLFR